MIRINQIKLPIGHSKKQLEDKIRKILKIRDGIEVEYEIFKKSLDARKKPELFYVYSVNVYTKDDNRILSKIKNSSVMSVKEKKYQFPDCGELSLRNRPVIVGAGPAGLFCAYLLTEAGYNPLVIERGKPVEERQLDVENFWKTGVLDTSSNVQFGEGGAGTFSDGKLNTAVKDPVGRNRFVLETFVRFGAPDNMLYDNKNDIENRDLYSLVNLKKINRSRANRILSIKSDNLTNSKNVFTYSDLLKRETVKEILLKESKILNI